MEAWEVPGSVEALTEQLETYVRRIENLLRQVAELEQENAVLERQIIIKTGRHAIEIRLKDERIAKRDAMLDWLADNAGIDGFAGIEKDRHEYALEAATEAGREEPNDDDRREGFRRLVRAAMETEKQ